MNERYVLSKVADFLNHDEYFIYHIIAKLIRTKSQENDAFIILTSKRLFIAIIEQNYLDVRYIAYKRSNPKYLYNKKTDTYRIINLFGSNEILELIKDFNENE